MGAVCETSMLRHRIRMPLRRARQSVRKFSSLRADSQRTIVRQSVRCPLFINDVAELRPQHGSRVDCAGHRERGSTGRTNWNRDLSIAGILCCRMGQTDSVRDRWLQGRCESVPTLVGGIQVAALIHIASYSCVRPARVSPSIYIQRPCNVTRRLPAHRYAPTTSSQPLV